MKIIRSSVENTNNLVTSPTAKSVAAIEDGFKFESDGKIMTIMLTNGKTSLEGITDVDAVKSEKPILIEFQRTLDGLTESLSNIFVESRSWLESFVRKGIAAVEPLIEEFNAIPGVSSVIKQILESFLDKLKKRST